MISAATSPENNLKQYITSSLTEVIRLLESTGNDRSEFEYAVYKMEQIVHIGVRPVKSKECGDGLFQSCCCVTSSMHTNCWIWNLLR
jgi:hypothetical protein